MILKNLYKIKNIIFDLGVVLLDLDFQKSAHAFKKLGFIGFENYYSKNHALHFFHAFETGHVSDKYFINEIITQNRLKATPDQIIKAWNEIIVGFPVEKVKFIHEVSKHYNIYMLSNTNIIHARKYERQFMDISGFSLNKYFKKIYYSHEIGLRKPDPEAFKIIFKENTIKPDQTLFIDDIEENLLPAKHLGMFTYHYLKEKNLFRIFNIDNNKI